jgi:hypothetical protein
VKVINLASTTENMSCNNLFHVGILTRYVYTESKIGYPGSITYKSLPVGALLNPRAAAHILPQMGRMERLISFSSFYT